MAFGTSYAPPNPTNDSTGWAGYTMRQVIPAALITTSGNQVRLTMKSGSESSDVLAAYIGHRSGSTYNFDGSQVPITVSASGAFTVGAGASVVSDAITFNLDETKDLILSVAMGSSGSFAQDDNVVGADSAYVAGSDASATTAASGYTANTPKVSFFILVETQTASTGVTGTLSAVEAQDVAAFAGNVASVGSLAVTEAKDVFAATGGLVAIGTLAATETADAFAATGAVVSSGTLAATEAKDAFAVAGLVAAFGPLAAVETQDAAAFAGTVASVGAWASTETPDVFLANGGAVATGSLAVTDAPDVAALAGTVASVGTLAATDAQDACAIAGTVASVGSLAAVEAPDVFVAAALAGVYGSWASTEGADAAQIVGTLPGVGPTGNSVMQLLRRKHRR